MIRKQDIVNRAAEWGLRPETVEKDYVLGWLLAAISQNSEARANWVFKGGTCIKKCYIETYRFSEDLDFSFLPDAAYTQEAVLAGLQEIGRRAVELCGIDIPIDDIRLDPRQNQRGQETFEGRLYYRGPLGTPTPFRIKFDITKHEAVVDTPVERSVFHPYTDSLPDGTKVKTYSYPELLAEKTRALFERSRPRDLYDVTFLLRNQVEQFDLSIVKNFFGTKCRSKSFEPPTATQLTDKVINSEEIRTDWAAMLAHQLPILPNVEEFVRQIGPLLVWLDNPATALPEASLPAAPATKDVLVHPAGLQYWNVGVPLETIRFSGVNRLLVEFDYESSNSGYKHRIVEPYSLRQATTGNLLLYGWEKGATHIRAYIVPKIQNLKPTQTAFTPRFEVEF
ncbi:MAG: nucleotidyl transferase AbiEii/AbiGii toxin family protein [Patescibacteria group bacterium]|jgi:predicted nucleotidyltransferase component of viral defense system